MSTEPKHSDELSRSLLADTPSSSFAPSSSSDNDPEQRLLYHSRPRFPRKWTDVVLISLVVTLICTNIIAVIRPLHITTASSSASDDSFFSKPHTIILHISHRSKHTLKTSTASLTSHQSYRMLHTWTAFSQPETADSSYASLTTNGFIALNHSFAATEHLPSSQDFPDDPSKGIYVLDGFHQLHCVIYLRTALQTLYNLQTSSPSSTEMDNDTDKAPFNTPWYHLEHCFDYLRQSIVCRADSTPMYLAPGNNLTAGDNQLRKCRDWSALEDFAKRNTACWPTGHCADLEDDDVKQVEILRGHGGH